MFIKKVALYPLLLYFYCIVLQLQFGNVASKPQSPMDAIAMGAMQAAGTAMEFFQNGAAIHRNHAFETPLISVRGKTDVGFGEAMREHGESSSSEESDEKRRKRRKRAAIVGSEMYLPPLFKLPSTDSFPGLLRNKRAPCKGTGSNTGGGGQGTVGDETDEVARKRGRTGKQKAKSTKSNTSKKANFLSRQRRQALEANDLEQEARDASNSITWLHEQAQEIAERMNIMWESLVQSMHETIQQVQRAFEDGAQTVTATKVTGSFRSTPTDAEYVNI